MTSSHRLTLDSQLVLLNMADHQLRSEAFRPAGAPPLTVGLLFGAQLGRRVEIFSSSELLVAADAEGRLVIDDAFLKMQTELS